MRYPKGSIQLSDSRDLPLLRQVLRSELVTHSQLFEFSQLDQHESSRNSFQWRVRRLVRRGLLLRRTLPAGTGNVVYSVASTAATLLQSMGEYCLIGPSWSGANAALPNALHAIGLNDVHLSALRAGVLLHWVGAMEIRSQNELTSFGFAKDYDAIVTVRPGKARFALEYERTLKSAKCYRAIAACVSRELRVNRLLYLVANYDILRFVSTFFASLEFPVCFGLAADWHTLLLEMPVCDGRAKRALRLRHVLLNSNESENAGRDSNYSLPFH